MGKKAALTQVDKASGVVTVPSAAADGALDGRGAVKGAMILLAARLQGKSRNGFALTAKTAGERLRISEVKARHELRQLCDDGLLIPVKRGGQGQPTVYRLAKAEEIVAKGASPKRVKKKPEAPKTAGVAVKATKAKASVPAPVDTAWRAWSEANMKLGRVAPVKLQPDIDSANELGRLVAEEQLSLDQLPAIFTAFLADAEEQLVREGHPIRLLPNRLNRYVNQAAVKPADDVKAAAEVKAAVAAGA